MELFKLFGSIFVDNEKANKSIHETESKAGNLASSMTKGIGTAAKWGAGIAVAAGSAATAIGGVAVKSAMDFEKEMANVATLLDGDVKTKISNLGDNVKQLASETGTSTELLTDGLYQVISAFGETEDSMKILETASKGALAGNATVADSVNLLSAVTKGYGDTSASAAQKASDLAFLTVKLGQTSFPELASSMGKVIPLASSLKVSQEELFGAMATLTGVTGGTAEVSTQLRATLQSLMKPSKEMSDALAAMGYESGAAALESLGLQGVLSGLKTQAGGNEVAFSNMFSSVEAGTAALALTGAQADNFIEKTKAMKDATGATENAFKKQTETVDAMFNKLKTNINVVAIELGEQLLPVANDIFKWVLDHLPEIQEILKIAFEKIGVFVNGAIDIFQNYLLPIFQAIFNWVSENWPTIQKIITGVFEAIKFVWENVLSPVLKVFWEVIKTIVATVEAIWPTIKVVFETVFNGIKAVWENVVKPVFEAITFIFKSVVDFVSNFFPGMQSVVSTVFGGIGKTVETVVGGFQRLIGWIKDAYNWLTKWNSTPVKSKSPSVSGRGGIMYGIGPPKSKNKIGLSYVPFDGYVAELHRGERVLTEQESRDYRNNKTGNRAPEPLSTNSTVEHVHSGTIRVEGYSEDDKETVMEIVMNQLREDNRL